MPEFGQDAGRARLRYDDAVNAERDRRIAAGFYFGPHRFDWDPKSQTLITGKATLAGFALAAGAVPGDLQWDGTGADFGWILADNTVLPLDAQGMFSVGVAAASHEQAHVFAARAIKEAANPPGDFTDDALWPVVAP